MATSFINFDGKGGGAVKEKVKKLKIKIVEEE